MLISIDLLFVWQAAADMMYKITKVSLYYLQHRGFSIGISDLSPSDNLLVKKTAALDKGYAEVEKSIKQLKENSLECMPGCSPEESLEQVT